MADGADIAYEYSQSDLERQIPAATRPRPVAVVWRTGSNRLTSMVFPESTVSGAKEKLRTEAEVDLETGQWAIAYFSGDECITSGVSELRERAASSLTGYVNA